MAQPSLNPPGAPAVGMNDISRIPGYGTGLAGEAYVASASIRSLETLKAVIYDEPQPDHRFTATEIVYGGRDSDTTVADFLQHDAGSLNGDGDRYEIGPGGVALTGYVYIPPGSHDITIHADDQYSLKIGGRLFSEDTTNNPKEPYEATANFAGGLYAVELLFVDAGGGSFLRMDIDGVPVDQSAFYKSVSDFTDPPNDTPTIPVDDYHPSHFVGIERRDGADQITGDDGRNKIDGEGGRDILDGGGNDDHLLGGYGDDKLIGGDGDDVMDGGRGSDLLLGGAGDDVLIARSDAGEQRIGQLAVGQPTRPDPDGEVNAGRQKLIGWLDQPLRGDDILVGGEGNDTFLISPQINGKREIIERHVRYDGSINWAGVAGENDELHDHWVDSFGIDVIADYNAAEDTIAIAGHTADIDHYGSITYRDVNGDGIEESIITVISKQRGNGGAHDKDLIGQVIVYGDRVEREDVLVDAGVTYGIVDNIRDLAEAIYPEGPSKVTSVGETTIRGYDTRGPNGQMGAITGDPENHVTNRYEDEVTYATGDAEPYEATRAPFDQVELREIAGVTRVGDNDHNVLRGDAQGGYKQPAALGYWTPEGRGTNAHADAMGNDPLKTYTLYENQALARAGDLVMGPDGTPATAWRFNGEDQFAHIKHNAAYQVTQGTIAIWVRPRDLDDKSVFLSKDARGTKDGGHFHLGHTSDGKLLLRFAPGDGESNKSWVADVGLAEGQWSHLAVNFTDKGLRIFVDGERVAGSAWTAVEGDLATPELLKTAYLLQNTEGWILGASSANTEANDSGGAFAADDDKLDDAFEGDLAGLGLWGGSQRRDALSKNEINKLIEDGADSFLMGKLAGAAEPSGDDTLKGRRGNDTLYGEDGDDTLVGGRGNDQLVGGYGDDFLKGAKGNDVLEGGFGSDILLAGAGDDLLISRSDVGEDRAGQLVLGAPSRPFPDASIDLTQLKLVDWVDQAVVGDDFLWGGAGNDHFYFELGINAKLDIIQKHVMDDRSIHWHGVAGENRRIHDHWVDGIGIDIIGDFNASQDKISVIGHTVNVKVSYHTIDTDGDGRDDDAVSVITAYSQQGNGGGAHDEDYLGYIVVFGDMVTEDMIETDAGVHHGVIKTIDELQTAMAPAGTKHAVEHDGQTLYGYDSRDVDGDPIGSRPVDFSQNQWLEQQSSRLKSSIADDLRKANIMLESDGDRFNGLTSFEEMDHTDAQARGNGTIALSFNADTIGNGNQTLFSKDHSGFGEGGHVMVYLDSQGFIRVRYQSETESFYLRSDERVEAGVDTHVAFAFNRWGGELYVDGQLNDSEEAYWGGMRNNTEDAVIGASTAARYQDNDNLRDFFDGSISDVVYLNRDLEPAEVLLLATADGEIGALSDTVRTGKRPAQQDDVYPDFEDDSGFVFDGAGMAYEAGSAPDQPWQADVAYPEFASEFDALAGNMPPDPSEIGLL
ncbi:MAG: LamG-like jellyroll fold domain-containing protein [Pseudomonadota bacterium]